MMEEKYHQIIYITLAKRIEKLERDLDAEIEAGKRLLESIKELEE